MCTLTLIYADGSQFLVGGFSSSDSANDWINIEKTRPYWVSTTITQITLIPISTFKL